MMRLQSLAICAVLIPLSFAAARAADLADLVVSQSTAERHGLVRAWMAQVSTSGVRGQTKYVVLDDDLMFVQTNDAMLYALDTETGRMIWSSEVGEVNRPTLRPGGNGRLLKSAGGSVPAPAAADAATPPADTKKKGPTKAAAPVKVVSPVVAVINGTDLYLLDRRDGRPHRDGKSGRVWKVSLRSPAVTGPLVTDDQVFVPTASGQIEIYYIDDLLQVGGGLSGEGQCVSPPILSGTRVAWGSDTGFIHITVADGAAVKYRIPTGVGIDAPLSARPPRVFVGSLDTSLYCVNDTSGAILWRFTTGSPIRQMPVVIGDGVYTSPEDGGLFRLAALDGRQEWFNPTPRKFLAASGTRIYTLDGFKRLEVLDAATGASVDLIDMPSAIQGLTNPQSDRIYLTSPDGLLQCLHEIGQKDPLNHIQFNPEKAATPTQTEPKKEGPPAPHPPPTGADAGAAAEKADAK